LIALTVNPLKISRKKVGKERKLDSYHQSLKADLDLDFLLNFVAENAFEFTGFLMHIYCNLISIFFLGILIPNKLSAESALLVAIAASLILRSISDIWMISNATIIESAIITMNKPKFRTSLVKFLAAMPAVSEFWHAFVK
jgi:hypothetical protein